MGPYWYEQARIVDWGPRYCRHPDCKRTYDAQLEAYHDADGAIDSPTYGQCYVSERRTEEGHGVMIPGYGGGNWWAAPAVLLEFDAGQQILCGFERGKYVRGQGRTDQLWAAILPYRSYDVVAAFQSLKPDYVRGTESYNRLAKDSGQEGMAIKRQGDLYFVECQNGRGPPKEATALDGATLPPGGTRSNHRASQVRMMCGPATDGSMMAFPRDNGWRIWARGQVLHPEHPRLCLGQKTWHRVLQSAAVRAVSSAYSHPPGGGGGAYGD